MFAGEGVPRVLGVAAGRFQGVFEFRDAPRALRGGVAERFELVARGAELRFELFHACGYARGARAFGLGLVAFGLKLRLERGDSVAEIVALVARFVGRGVGFGAERGERLVVRARGVGELGVEFAFRLASCRRTGSFLGARPLGVRFRAGLSERIVELFFALFFRGRDRGFEVRLGPALALVEIRTKRGFAGVALRDFGVVGGLAFGELGGCRVEVRLELLALALEVIGALARLVLVVLRSFFPLGGVRHRCARGR